MLYGLILSVWIYVSFLYYNLSAILSSSSQQSIFATYGTLPKLEAMIISGDVSHTAKPFFL
jgi:hypothetical protein